MKVNCNIEIEDAKSLKGFTRILQTMIDDYEDNNSEDFHEIYITNIKIVKDND